MVCIPTVAKSKSAGSFTFFFEDFLAAPAFFSSWAFNLLNTFCKTWLELVAKVTRYDFVSSVGSIHFP